MSRSRTGTFSPPRGYGLPSSSSILGSTFCTDSCTNRNGFTVSFSPFCRSHITRFVSNWAGSGTFHSRHHRLYVPYAFGALYNHPFEGLLMDTLGAGIAYKISGLKTRGGVFFFTFSTMKTVDDHCGYSLPFDPLQYFFWNNAGYHDVHHQGWGIKVGSPLNFIIGQITHRL